MPATFEPRLDILPESRELDPADPDAWIQRKRDTLEAFVERGGPVKLALASKAIDRNFDTGISIRALQFYGDGTLDRVPAAMRRDLTRWVRAADLRKLPELRSRQGLHPEGLKR
jgi:hypothetical protein